jgi:hypothetical protein
LAQSQADVVKCEAAVSEAKILLKAATATINNLEAEHVNLIADIPTLEAQKKAAATKRDFKAASKASKEIKDATARLKECEEELVGEATEKKTAAAEELTKLDAELVATRKIAQAKEKVAGLSKMQALAKQIQHLGTTKKTLCGKTTSSENSVRGVGALVLDGQIKALNDEGETLGSKYGGWSELVNGGLDDDAEGEAEEEESPEAAPEPSKEEEAPPAPAPELDDGLTSEERVAKVKDLIKRIQQAEQALEAAAAREDYDEAAELQEVFSNLQAELENVNLTDEESELAFTDEDESVPAASEEKPAEESTTVSIEATSTEEPDAPVEEVAKEENPEKAAQVEVVEEAAIEETSVEAEETEDSDDQAGEGNDQADVAEPNEDTDAPTKPVEDESPEENGAVVENGDEQPKYIEEDATETPGSDKPEEVTGNNTATEDLQPET